MRTAGVLQQDRTDLVQLDPEVADLHLAVDAPEVFETAVRAKPSRVTTGVQGAVGERVRHEPPGGQLLLAETAERDPRAADALTSVWWMSSNWADAEGIWLSTVTCSATSRSRNRPGSRETKFA
ncbi:hypothetical protein [Streptomyces sp. DSM 40750]|uniref:hypothetical protein n=1 Tax=Streptomyces sp. DSM 40750 TaxID=2801030 RepID=UPI002F3E9918